LWEGTFGTTCAEGFEAPPFPINKILICSAQVVPRSEAMMNEELLQDQVAYDAALLELGVVLGQNYAFGLIAGRCSAAQAQALHRLREEQLYKRCAETWLEFCPKYLKMSRTEADRTIKLLEEFGPAYFELSQLTRVSPETYRAIAPAIENGVLRFNGEEIPLNAENSRKVAAAVAEMRSAIPKKSPVEESLERKIDALCHETVLLERIAKLDECGQTLVAEFEKIACDKGLGEMASYFATALARALDGLARVAEESGLAFEDPANPA
jgi:hypothetical protein